MKNFRSVLFILGLGLLWQGLASSGIYPSYVFPSPAGVFRSLNEGLSDGSFIVGTGISLKRILIGFGSSVLFGIILGFAIGRLKIVEDTIGPLVLGLQTLPSICWLPIALLWFGLNENAIIFVVIMGALLSVTIATTDGVKNIQPVLIKAAKTMGARGIFLYRSVIFPAAMPAIITGIKLGWSFAWRSLMAGELLFVSGGLGFLLQSGRELNDINRVVAIMIVIILIGLITDNLIFSRLERLVRHRWGLSTERS